MSNIIYTEYLKLKRMYVFFLPMVAAVLYQIFDCMSWLKNMSNSMVNSDYEQHYKMAFFPNKCIIIYAILFFVMFSVLSGYIFFKEHSDKMESIVYSYSVSRVKIAIAKVVVIGGIIIISYIVNYIAGNISYYVCFHEFPYAKLQLEYIKVSIYSALGQLLLIPIPILITNMSRNIIVTLIYSILGCITNMAVFGKYFFRQLCPIMLPVMPIFYFWDGEIIDYGILGINVFILMFIIFPIMFIHLKKMQIK